jgi:hypothetical protein
MEAVTAAVVVASTAVEEAAGSTVAEEASTVVAAGFMAVEALAQAEAFTVEVQAERTAAELLEPIAAVQAPLVAVPTVLLMSAVEQLRA